MSPRPAALLALCLAAAASPAPAQERPRPNVLWITSEDNGPQLGCYGDRYADTPNLDRLAARGLRYRVCWSNAPVCAPARTAIVSGLYPTSTGTEHMRSTARLPAGFRMFPQYLREAGYYCTNNHKKDYNLVEPGRVWDESSPKAHWRHRAPGQPFFAVFNITATHESRIRKRPHELQHDPRKVRVPAYHPDTPEVRRDWAQYYDQLTVMDRQVGRRLRELERAGLREDTIVFYFADHGPGMPRCKRWPYDSGLHVPLIVFVPPKFAHLRPKDYRPGGATDRLVSFVDLAPTVLSLAGIRPPEHFQGRAFLGAFAAEPRRYLFGFRGRMDERYDLVRSVRDGRWIYLRNFHPHEPYGQYVSYMFQTPTTRVWKAAFEAGRTNAAQSAFWRTKPAEELYDLEADPDEVRNLAADPEHSETLERLRAALRGWMLEVRDVGLLPENEIHERSKDRTPYEMARGEGYPLERLLDLAEAASRPDRDGTAELLAALRDQDGAIRYWAAMGLLIRGAKGVEAAGAALRAALEDESPSVRIVAAEALARFGPEQDLPRALETLLAAADLETNSLFTVLEALDALDDLDEKARAVRDRIVALPLETASVPRRMRGYVPRLVEKILADLGRGR